MQAFTRLLLLTFLFGIFFYFQPPQARAAKIRPKGKITGRVIDEKDRPIAGANIFIEGTLLGAASRLDGQFIIKYVPDGKYKLVINMIGYYRHTIDVEVSKGRHLDLKSIRLKSVPLESQPIVVTASKYEQKVENVPASISSISRMEIENRNTVTVDKVLQYVSGLNMNGDQVNIRGSTGYSKGVGSRVLMLLDGVPFLAGDTEGMVFEGIAVNEIDRIEIIKGTGSALYGSSAMGGVINLITKPVSEKPEFYFQAYGGLYEKPYYDQWRWSDRTRYLHGFKANYSQRIRGFGFRLAATRDVDDSYRRNDYKNRYNINTKLQYDITARDQVTVSANFMEQTRGNYLNWKDINNALVPPDDQLTSNVYAYRYYVMPIYRKVLSSDSYFKVKSIWYHNYFKINEPLTTSTSDYYYMEFQYGVKVADKHVLSFGLTPSYNKVSSNIFGDNEGVGVAVYMQDEMVFTDKWIFTLGARYDYFNIDELGTDNSISPKVGLVFKPKKGTALRFSMGTGFRAPSMGEAFTTTSMGNFLVIPNPNLKAEDSFSMEIGWRQTYNDYLSSDIAVFYSRYRDLIEASFITEGENKGKIQFQNVVEARTGGTEININFQPLPKQLFFNLGYTFVYPRNIELKDYLKYRPRHLLYLHGRWMTGIWTLGADYRFISRYDRIDEELSAIIPDADVRGNAHVVDMRLETDFRWRTMLWRLTLQANNLLQYHYIDQPGSIAPIRNYVLTLGLQM